MLTSLRSFVARFRTRSHDRGKHIAGHLPAVARNADFDD
jgi:hypothetical protein